MCAYLIILQDLVILEIGMVDWLSKMWSGAERIGTK